MKIGDYIVISSAYLLEKKYDIIVMRKTVQLYHKNTDRLVAKIEKSQYDYLTNRRIVQIYDFTGYNDFTDGAPITRLGFFPFQKWIVVDPHLIEEIIVNK